MPGFSYDGAMERGTPELDRAELDPPVPPAAELDGYYDDSPSGPGNWVPGPRPDPLRGWWSADTAG